MENCLPNAGQKMSRFVKETEQKNEGFSASLTLLFGFEFNYVEEHLVNCHTQRDEEELARRREKGIPINYHKCSLAEPEQSCTIIKIEKNRDLFCVIHS